MSSPHTSEQRTLSVSCVTYATDIELLSTVITSVKKAVDQAEQQGISLKVDFSLIDNGPDKSNLNNLKDLQAAFQKNFNKLDILSGHGNIGYGRANNLAIRQSNTKYHLILNPDAILDSDVIAVAVQHLEKDKDLALAAPFATDQDNNPQFLAKRFPSLLTLFLRLLNNKALNQCFQDKLKFYEYRDQKPQETSFDIKLASGCFMFCRTDALKAVNGFSSAYFMYFEDFDLSIRLRRDYKIKHFHDLKITHHGGNASKKGLRHLRYFLVSAAKFYFTHYPCK